MRTFEKLLLAVLSSATLLAGCSEAPPAGPAADPQPSGPRSERIVYRVEDLSQGAGRVTTVVVESAPPYLARTLTLDGPPPGGKSLGGAAWDADFQYLLGPSGDAAVVQGVAPGPAGVDAHLDVALASAERHGLARRSATASVAGLACQSWLTKEPLDSAPFGPATAGDSTESCVDARGRLLRDAWTLGGRLVRTRTAVTVGDGPDLTGLALLGGRTAKPADDTQVAERVRSEPAAKLAAAFAIPVPAGPPGFELDRSTAFITVGSTGQARTEGTVYTFRSGSRLAVLRLEQGLGFRLPDPTTGVAVRLPTGRAARLSPYVNGLRLRVAARPGRVVSASADLPEEVLLAWVAGLRLS